MSHDVRRTRSLRPSSTSQEADSAIEIIAWVVLYILFVISGGM